MNIIIIILMNIVSTNANTNKKYMYFMLYYTQCVLHYTHTNTHISVKSYCNSGRKATNELSSAE